MRNLNKPLQPTSGTLTSDETHNDRACRSRLSVGVGPPRTQTA
jgi:hypothetical protein